MIKYYLYFTYGSNMHEERFRGRCPSALLARSIGIVDNYKLVFNRVGDYENGGVASIVPFKGETVYGAIYIINFEDLNKLDEIESPNGQSYYRKLIAVKTIDNQKLNCFTYLSYPQGNFKPTSKYLNWIIKGGKDIGLPKRYIKKLKSIPIIE